MAAVPKLFSKSVLSNAAKCPFVRSSALSQETLNQPRTVTNAVQLCPYLVEQTQTKSPEHLFSIPTSVKSRSHSQANASTSANARLAETATCEHCGVAKAAAAGVTPVNKTYEEVFEKEVSKVKAEGRYRVFADLERKAGSFPLAACHNTQAGTVKQVTGWCSNDYLSMGQRPEVIEAMVNAAKKCGTGAGGTRNISGTNHFHVLLEKELASLHNKEASLVFSSCYVANETTLTTMSKMLPNSIVFSDQHNHASMIQGIRNGTWEKKVYKHNDLNHLESLLKAQPIDRYKVVAFESVNSMEGSIAPLNELAFLARKYNAMTFVDEVHAVGMYGETGAGVAERDDCESGMDIISGTLGKAFGVMGGYVAGSKWYIDAMRSNCPGFIFTTAIPPPIAAAVLKSVQLLRSEEGAKERIKMHSNANKLQSRLREIGLPLMPTVSHITPVLVGNAEKCKKVTDVLLNRYGIYVQPINYPTVAKGTERLRITPLPVHTEEMMTYFLKALDEVWTEFELPRKYFSESELQAFGHNQRGVETADFAVGGQRVYEFFSNQYKQEWAYPWMDTAFTNDFAARSTSVPISAAA